MRQSDGRLAVILYSAINIPYWLSLSYLMQDPIGVVLIVIAFLMAGLCVAPLKSGYSSLHRVLISRQPLGWTASIQRCLLLHCSSGLRWMSLLHS